MAFWALFKFLKRGWDQKLEDFNRFLHIETRSCFSCLVLYLHHTYFSSRQILTLPRRGPLSYRNQSIDLQSRYIIGASVMTQLSKAQFETLSNIPPLKVSQSIDKSAFFTSIRTRKTLNTDHFPRSVYKIKCRSWKRI